MFCSLQSNTAPAIIYGQRVDCFGVTAGSCRSLLLHRDKDKAGSARVNKSRHVKNVTITTNNRIQASFNSIRRKKAKHWTQNQLTNRMHNYQENTNLIGNVQTQTDGMICFYSNIGCAESKVIFK